MTTRSLVQPISSQSQSRSPSLEVTPSASTGAQGIRAVGNNALPIPGLISALRYVWNTGSRLLAHCFKDPQYCSPLGKKLRNALVPDPLDKHAFLPVTAISELLTEKSIRDELAVHPCIHVSQNASRWAALIVSPSQASATGARKIFGLLSLINRVDLIEGFLESKSRHLDDELPFTRQDLPLDDQPCKYEFLRGVPYFILGNILNMQWWFLAPVFEKARPGNPVQNLPEGVTLPMSSGNEQLPPDTGHSGTVTKVMVHVAHYTRDQEPVSVQDHVTDLNTAAAELDSNGMMSCAIKQLHLTDGARYEGHYADACKRETDNLLRVGETPHPNLIELLFSYFHKGRCYLVFPWANENLRDFWRKWPIPDWLGPQDHLVKWIFSQALGLIQALELIHDTGLGSAPSGQGAATYGTHGDLKPENILWFMGRFKLKELPNLGLLKISDFAGTQFHRKISKSRVIWAKLHTTDTYQAPETMTDYMVGQGYDLWSLGCVFLEFMTWYILGWQGVDNFSIARSVDNDPSDAKTDDNEVFLQRYEKRRQASWTECNRHFAWPSDTFFYSLPHGAKLKRSVQNLTPELQHLNQLYRDPKCSRFCAAFLKVIEECFLRIDKRNRVSTKDVLEQFDAIRLESEADPEYWTKPPTIPVRARTDLSERIVEVSDLNEVLEPSPEGRDSHEGGPYVTEAHKGQTGQFADEPHIVVTESGADHSLPKDQGFLAPATVLEGDTRASYTSSRTAVSSQPDADDIKNSPDCCKVEAKTEEKRADQVVVLRKRDMIRGFFRAIRGEFAGPFTEKVKTHFDQLYKHPSCPQFSTDLFKVIGDCLLRVNRGNRMSINDIIKRLDEMKVEDETHIEYWAEPPKNPNRANTGLSELTPERRPSTTKKVVPPPVTLQPTKQITDTPLSRDTTVPRGLYKIVHLAEPAEVSRRDETASVTAPGDQKPQAEKPLHHGHDPELPIISEHPSQQSSSEASAPRSVIADNTQDHEGQSAFEPPSPTQRRQEMMHAVTEPRCDHPTAQRYLTPSAGYNPRGRRNSCGSSQNTASQASDFEKSPRSPDREIARRETDKVITTEFEEWS
ncbi:protein kinase domain-containing protein [Apiospora marii]|uniref:protein kinase domain-containing protein n=1 Tax=Apiospora marii TaxID=335849 RepID=UPI003131165A